MEAHWQEAHPSEEETAKQRLDRNFNELLQELRVTQTGVQILLGFLLTMVFSSGFSKVTGWELGLYAVAVGLTTLAMGLLLAPVALHRVLFRRGMKPHLVRLTHVLTFLGLLVLMLAVSTAVALALVVALGRITGVVMGVVTLIALLMIWYGLPIVALLRHRADNVGERS
ncbi:MAG TPA: DUF6328 family protein [Actinomycetes bacterium]|nr:DUF6328 family protein [Actinomycetes bacterium]